MHCVCYCACLLLWQQITISTLDTRLIASAASLGECNVPEESDEKRLLPPAALDPSSSHGHCIWLRLWSRWLPRSWSWDVWTYSLGLLIICHLANFTVITKKQSLTTGSTEVQTCPTAWPVLIAHACMSVCVCVYVSANFIDKNYARLGDKEIWPHVSQLDSAKNQRTTLKQRRQNKEKANTEEK